MTLSDIMQQYKKIKSKYVTVQSQFDKFKQIFERDFNEEIVILERKRIDESQQEALRQVQEEQNPKPRKDVGIGGNVEVSLRELPKAPGASDADSGAPRLEPDPESASASRTEKPPSAPTSKPKAKMTKRKLHSEPETAVAAKPPNLTGQLSKLYRKLCKKFHPDICGSDEHFLKLQQIYEQGDNIELIEIAMDHDIQVDEYIQNKEQMIEYWKTEIIRIDKEIYNMTHMLPWVWCMADTERKQELRPTMIKHLQST